MLFGSQVQVPLMHTKPSIVLQVIGGQPQLLLSLRFAGPQQKILSIFPIVEEWLQVLPLGQKLRQLMHRSLPELMGQHTSLAVGSVMSVGGLHSDVPPGHWQRPLTQT